MKYADIIVGLIAILMGHVVALFVLPVLFWIWGYEFGKTYALSAEYNEKNTEVFWLVLGLVVLLVWIAGPFFILAAILSYAGFTFGEAKSTVSLQAQDFIQREARKEAFRSQFKD